MYLRLGSVESDMKHCNGRRLSLQYNHDKDRQSIDPYFKVGSSCKYFYSMIIENRVRLFNDPGISQLRFLF